MNLLEIMQAHETPSEQAIACLLELTTLPVDHVATRADMRAAAVTFGLWDVAGQLKRIADAGITGSGALGVVTYSGDAQ